MSDPLPPGTDTGVGKEPAVVLKTFNSIPRHTPPPSRVPRHLNKHHMAMARVHLRVLELVARLALPLLASAVLVYPDEWVNMVV